LLKTIVISIFEIKISETIKKFRTAVVRTKSKLISRTKVTMKRRNGSGQENPLALKKRRQKMKPNYVGRYL
jgi:hypothetical protein